MASEQEQLLYPYEGYRQKREYTPVVFNEAYGSWNIYSYAEVQRVLSDYDHFSSQFMGGDMDSNPLGTSIINLDPPRHRKLRSIVTQAFTPRRVAQLAPRIEGLVGEMIDAVAAKGTMDVIDDLGYPLPVIVIAELLGIPAEDRARFKHWSDVLVGAKQSDELNPQREMGRYFAQLLEQRRQEPQDDLLTALLDAEVDGEQLTLEELLGFCILLLVAGNVTTTALLGNIFWSFDEHPAALARLYADPSLIPSAIEEVLRYRSPVFCMYRICKAPTVLGNQQIQSGQFIVSYIASANRDESVFTHADEFDLTRSPNRHLAFGHGIHFCLGAPLARLEAKIALTTMLARLPEIRRVRNVSLTPVSSMILHSIEHFPITFRKG